MTRVLLTAFQPYDNWTTNASWLALVELTRDLPSHLNVTTRLYPVDYDGLLERLMSDLHDRYDYAILTGQAPGRSRVELETVALNLRSDGSASTRPAQQLVDGAPLAYASSLPADSLCESVRTAGIPAAVSYHGGTYLCNAALYFALHQTAHRQLSTQSIFVHLPIDTTQAARCTGAIPSLAMSESARALQIILMNLAGDSWSDQESWA